MSKKQLALIFAIGVVQWIIGNGLFPLLPVYSLQLGADVSFTGNVISFSFLMVVISAMLTGWLSDRFQRRKLMLIASGILFSLSLVLMSRAQDPWELAIYLAINWFFLGVGIALLAIFAGLSAEESERGKVFGILALTGGFGLFIGGLLLGPIADRWGYPTLFFGLAIFGLLWPVLGLFVKEKHIYHAQEEKTGKPWGAIDRKLWLFLISFTAAWIGFFIGRLGISIEMESLDFSSTAISSTAAVAGAITLPLPFVLGWLSDRTARLPIIAIAFLLAAFGLGALSVAGELWQFWTATVLISMVGVVFGVGSAYIADSVPAESIGVGLSLFESTTWVAGIIGAAGVGYTIELLGLVPSVIIGVALFLVAIVILAASARSRKAQPVSAAGATNQ